MRRRLMAVAWCITLLAAAGCSGDDDSGTATTTTVETTATTAAVDTTTTTVLTNPPVDVIGPTQNGTRANAFAAASIDVGALGYFEEEYFLDGEAQSYALAPGTDYTADGHWQLVADKTAPFRTRILVLRPVDPAKFSGNVIVSWLNVTAGFEINGVTERALRDGHGLVSLSAQKVGLDGFPGAEANGLRQWDPQRYGALNHPGDDFSFDILTKTAQVVGPRRGAIKPDPMAGLTVKRVFATGGSQSAARLNSYINGVQPLTHAFDGFLPLVSGGAAVQFQSKPTDIFGLFVPGGTRIRDDIDVPILIFSSETEADSLFKVRQPDTDKVRTWEIAGAAHAGGAGANSDLVTVFTRDGLKIPSGLGATESGPDAVLPDQVSYFPMVNAARAHLLSWAAGGAPPPSMPLIEFAADTISRDQYGNALGGIRPPELEVPVATYKGRGPGGGLAVLSGSMVPFAKEQIKQLYPTLDTYLEGYAKAVQRGVDAGYILQADVKEINAAAAEHAKTIFT